MDTLLDKLVVIQKALNLSERDFAAKMGINHATWNQTRRGIVTLNETVLAGALNAFPELEKDIHAYREAQIRAKAQQLATTKA